MSDVGKLEGLLARIEKNRRPEPKGLEAMLRSIGTASTSTPSPAPASPARRAPIPTPLETAIAGTNAGTPEGGLPTRPQPAVLELVREPPSLELEVVMDMSSDDMQVAEAADIAAAEQRDR